MSKFKVGNTLGGRKKGSVNATNKKSKELFNLLLQENLVDLQSVLSDIKESNPVEYVRLVLKIAEFSIGKVASVTPITIVEPQNYTIEFQ